MNRKRIFIVKSDGRLRAIDVADNEREKSRLLRETFSGTDPEEVQLEKHGKISYFMMYSPMLGYDTKYHKKNKASQLRGKQVRGPVMIYKKKKSKYHEHWKPGLSF